MPPNGTNSIPHFRNELGHAMKNKRTALDKGLKRIHERCTRGPIKIY